ncbi:MAG: hypothetical protein Q9227_005179 [Pyrenula ochraceoflavens]
MRLINVCTKQLEEFYGEDSPKYAILSHTWEKEEISLEEFGTVAAQQKVGYRKVLNFCDLAVREGHNYVWVDTCCIDKRSSADLSEAINSMCAWYQGSSVCYAYLADIDGSLNEEDLFLSRWWTRGWTLQVSFCSQISLRLDRLGAHTSLEKELIAPEEVIFLDKSWKQIGTKRSYVPAIAKETGIRVAALSSLNRARRMSVAQRMSWASKRSTTRIEDRAYSLLGLFDVNMPLLYGEGSKAFIRLQEEIIKHSSDQSIFAWDFELDTNLSREDLMSPSPAYQAEHNTITRANDSFGTHEFKSVTPFATSPEAFRCSGDLFHSPTHDRSMTFGITNLGLQMNLPVARIFPSRVSWSCSDNYYDHYIGLLSCYLEQHPGHFIGLILRQESREGSWVRVRQSLTSKAAFVFSPLEVCGATLRSIDLVNNVHEARWGASWFPWKMRLLKDYESNLVVRIHPDISGQGWSMFDAIGTDLHESFAFDQGQGQLQPTHIIRNKPKGRLWDGSCRLTFKSPYESTNSSEPHEFWIEFKDDIRQALSCCLIMSKTATCAVDGQRTGTEVKVNIDRYTIISTANKFDIHVSFMVNTMMDEKIFVILLEPRQMRGFLSRFKPLGS